MALGHPAELGENCLYRLPMPVATGPKAAQSKEWWGEVGQESLVDAQRATNRHAPKAREGP